MEWFYSVGSERKGPVSESDLRALIASGNIKPDTLVWKQGFPDWKAAAAAGLFPGDPGTGTDGHICIITGKTFPKALMIETADGWVSVEGRDTYYQCLRERVPFPTAGGAFSARADGRFIVVLVADSRLPPRCIITNQPVASGDMLRKKLYWCPPLVFLSLLLNILILLVLYFVFRKRVTIDVPLSPEGQRDLTKRQLRAACIVSAGIGLIVYGLITNVGVGAAATILGVVALLVGVIYAGRRAQLLRVVRLKNGEAWLAGAGKEFLASLPAYVK